MTLAQALQAAEDEYVQHPEPDAAIVSDQLVIQDSSPCGYIVGTNLETVPRVGIAAALECAVVMAIRFGMRTQRILQRAETSVQPETHERPN